MGIVLGLVRGIVRIAAGLLLATTIVVAGLLTFPTACVCGGVTPHPHALLVLAGHDHELERGHHPGGDYGNAIDPAVAHHGAAASDASTDGPVLEPLAGDHGGDQFTATAVNGAFLRPPALAIPIPVSAHRPSGLTTPPEIPPPRA